MKLPVPQLAANIERRLLINYRLDPSVAQTLLPSSLRPQLIGASAVAGICLLRLGALRPQWMKPQIGWGSENVAHRIAVEWDDATGTHAGVYIPQRHSASWLPVAVGGRLFPGVHKHAHFESTESEANIRVAMRSSDTTVSADIDIDMDIATNWHSSLFSSVADASAFFQNGSVGWSPSRDGSTLQGLALETSRWRVEPGRVLDVRSSFFDSLPAGSAVLDSVLVMRDVPITWSVPTGGPGVQRAVAATAI